MNKQFINYLQFSLIVLDLLLLNISYILNRVIFSSRIADDSIGSYLSFLLFSNSIWILLVFILGNYTEKIVLNFELFTKRTIQLFLLWMVILLIYLFFSRELIISRFFIIGFITSYSICLFINKFLYLGIRNYFRTKEKLVNKVIILGYNDTAVKLSSYFEQESINTNLIGFAEDEDKIHELTHYPVLSSVKNVIQLAKDYDVQEIYSTISPSENELIYKLIEQAENECIRFKVVPNLSFFFSKPMIVDFIRDLPIISLRNEPLEDVGNRVKKRALDIVVSFFVVVLILSWLVPLVGLLILLESRGSIFFIQKRTGKNNRPFNCYKFRSMKTDNKAEFRQATKNDARVTKIGLILRKTSLDEFPQFINVLKGEMSLVGPRPHPIKMTDDLVQVVDHYMVRHFSKPGITGWAQINGYRGEIKDEKQIKQRVSYDLWYMENWTIWLDIKILFLTIYSIIKGDKNAY